MVQETPPQALSGAPPCIICLRWTLGHRCTKLSKAPSGFWDRGFKVDPHRSRSRGFDFRKSIPPGRETGRVWVFYVAHLSTDPAALKGPKESTPERGFANPAVVPHLVLGMFPIRQFSKQFRGPETRFGKTSGPEPARTWHVVLALRPAFGPRDEFFLDRVVPRRSTARTGPNAWP